jgi:mono/diheme cytochrome c family protein
MTGRTIFSGACVVWWLSGSVLLADDRVEYVRGVKPIFTARCYACHGALKQQNGLRLDTVEFMKKGGDTGPAIVPGRSAESRLVDHITGTGGARRKPPKSEGEGLDERQIAAIKAWIDQGAVGPADEKPEPDPRAHWAFKAPARPALPKVKDTAWAKNPIDAFLAAEHEKRGLVPQRLADKSVLLRRVYLDLIGLPPTRDELSAFLKDESPDADEKVVDRLLASKQYGERWGRHWMDVWRYSDWWGLGAEVRNSQKHIWHWRDWIIESLNADKGYDQMLREILAADELYPTDPDRLRATGFLTRSCFIFNRNSWLEEVVEHTSKAFLGVTLNCARCHDHKYDPTL